MAFNKDQPSTANTYTAFASYIRENVLSVGMWLDSQYVPLTGVTQDYTKRYDRSSGTIVEWYNSTWNRVKLMATGVQVTTVANGVADPVICTMADNDFFRIRVGSIGGAANSGYVEFSTADDGNEPILFSQYTGIYATLVRELVLLDGSGNSRFPGIIYPQVTGANDFGSGNNKWKDGYFSGNVSAGVVQAGTFSARTTGTEGGQLSLYNKDDNFGPGAGGVNGSGALVDVDAGNRLRILNFANTDTIFHNNGTVQLVLDAGGTLRPGISGSNLGYPGFNWGNVYGTYFTGNAETSTNAGGPVFGTQAAATEAQLIVRKSGYADAYLYSNAGQWGLYSAAGGNILTHDRNTGVNSFAGNADSSSGDLGRNCTSYNRLTADRGSVYINSTGVTKVVVLEVYTSTVLDLMFYVGVYPGAMGQVGKITTPSSSAYSTVTLIVPNGCSYFYDRTTSSVTAGVRCILQ